jgi:hypothetical protein
MVPVLLYFSYAARVTLILNGGPGRDGVRKVRYLMKISELPTINMPQTVMPFVILLKGLSLCSAHLIQA